MSRSLTRLFVPLILAVALPCLASAQQPSDPTFVTKVARPMFVGHHPRLLVDQGHFNTHTTHIYYDALAQLAIGDGFEVFTDANPFSQRDLKGAEVLLIANPLGCEDLTSPRVTNPAFTKAECDAVHAWVEAGGALLLIVDHAPMGIAARPMGTRFGVDFSAAYLVDSALADSSFGASTLVFSQATGTLGEHVIMHGRSPAERIKRVRTYTGQSLSVPPGSVALLKVTSHAQDIMLGPASGLGVVPDSLKHSAAGRAQAIAFTVGKGRVVMIGEGSVFVAQVKQGRDGKDHKVGMNSPGFDNRQFALNVLRWLAKGLN